MSQTLLVLAAFIIALGIGIFIGKILFSAKSQSEKSGLEERINGLLNQIEQLKIQFQTERNQFEKALAQLNSEKENLQKEKESLAIHLAKKENDLSCLVRGYLDGSFYALFYKKENHQQASILDNLDAQILYDKVLIPLLGIEDLRNDERIDYIPGKQSISVIKDLIDEREFEVGFMLYPSDINEIKALADNNLIMPPKSTYIEPKFRSGLVVYEL